MKPCANWLHSLLIYGKVETDLSYIRMATVKSCSLCCEFTTIGQL